MPIWRRAVNAIELFEIEGDHSTIMEKPHVATLAAQFSRCLAAAQFATRQPEIEICESSVQDFLRQSPDTALQGGS
jgi:hypothetical protein